MKTIMHLIATSFFGGPEKQIVEHLKRLDPALYHGAVASFIESNGPNEFLDKAAEAGIKNIGIPMSSPIDIRALRMLIKTLKEEEIDLLCTHGYKSSVMGWLAAKLTGISVLAFSRGYTGENKKVAFYEWLDRKFVGFSDGVVCVSDGQKEKLKKLGVDVERKKNWVVHNAAVLNFSGDGRKDDHQVFREKFGIDKDAVITVAAGRLSPEKGHRYLVEALALLKQQKRQIVCLICGDGMCREGLEEQAKVMGVSEECKFVGFRKDVNYFFQQMDFMVLPSLTEGLPNVILESFALKKTVVATSVGGVPEIVSEGENGLMVEAGNATMLADAMAVMLESKERREKMGKTGYELVCKEFTFEKQTAKLQAIYEEILRETME